MRRLIDGMVVVITGASAGIGRAAAEWLGAEGAKLSLAARRAERLNELNELLGGGHLALPTDVSDPVQCAALIHRTVERFGRLDTLICNAGYGILRPVEGTSAEEMAAIFQTNVFGTADCIRAAVPIMRQQPPRQGWRGQLMIVSSAVARRGLPCFGAYSATKAAQLSLAEALRVELRDAQIAVTSVHPVGTDTEFGDVSAHHSAGQRPTTHNEVRQSAQTVARAMCRAIKRPRPEVWPLRPSRWALSAATLLPSLADHILRNRMKKP